MTRRLKCRRETRLVARHGFAVRRPSAKVTKDGHRFGKRLRLIRESFLTSGRNDDPINSATLLTRAPYPILGKAVLSSRKVL